VSGLRGHSFAQIAQGQPTSINIDFQFVKRPNPLVNQSISFSKILVAELWVRYGRKENRDLTAGARSPLPQNECLTFFQRIEKTQFLASYPPILAVIAIFNEYKCILSVGVESDDMPIKEIKRVNAAGEGKIRIPVVLCHLWDTPTANQQVDFGW
jgi:hypothetical protein